MELKVGMKFKVSDNLRYEFYRNITYTIMSFDHFDIEFHVIGPDIDTFVKISTFNFNNDLNDGVFVIISDVPKKSPVEVKKGLCSHPRAYINTAYFKKFKVCPDCKEDLGDI